MIDETTTGAVVNKLHYVVSLTQSYGVPGAITWNAMCSCGAPMNGYGIASLHIGSLVDHPVKP